MIPDRRKRFIDLRVVKDVVSAVAVEVVFAEGDPVDGKAKAVLFGDIRIQAAIVLGSCKFGRVDRVVIRNVGHVAQGTARGSATCASASTSGVRGTRPALILCPQARRQRRAD